MECIYFGFLPKVKDIKNRHMKTWLSCDNLQRNKDAPEADSKESSSPKRRLATTECSLDGAWTLKEGTRSIGKILVDGTRVVFTNWADERFVWEVRDGILQSDEDKATGDCWVMERQGEAIDWHAAHVSALTPTEPRLTYRWEKVRSPQKRRRK